MSEDLNITKKGCPKNKVNGPCCGVINGKCEVYPDNECIWTVIYKKNGSLGGYKPVVEFIKKEERRKKKEEKMDPQSL